MLYLGLLIFGMLPGSFVACARRTAFGSAATVALAVALSPLVVFVEYVAARWLCGDFGATTWYLAWINALGLPLLLWRAAPRRPLPDFRLPLVTIGIVVACLCIPWVMRPEFARLSWHGLMHSDICHSLTRGGVVPEDPELAGIRLAYPWASHVQWTLAAGWADANPTRVYLPLNVIWLAASGVLLWSAMRTLGVSTRTAAVGALLAAVGTNLVGVVGWSVVSERPSAVGMATMLLGDARNAPFLLKFVTMNAMPAGDLLFCAMLLLLVRAVHRHEATAMLLLPVVLLGLGIVYPNLLPAGAVALLAGMIACFGIRNESGDSARGARCLVAMSMSVAAIVLSYFVVRLYTSSGGGGAIGVSRPGDMAKKAAAAGVALFPFFAAGAWGWTRASRFDRPVLLALLAAGILTAVFNVVLRLGGSNEYKFIPCAGLCLLLPACIALEPWLSRRALRGAACMAALTAMLATSMTAYAQRRTPTTQVVSRRIVTNGFHAAFAAGDPMAEWTDAVRTQTPADAVLLVHQPGFDAAALTGRGLYVPSDGDAFSPGYNMKSRYNLVDLRGYDGRMFDRRVKHLNAICLDGGDAAFDAALSDVQGLKRPIAIVIDRDSPSGSAARLRARRDFRELSLRGAHAVFVSQ